MSPKLLSSQAKLSKLSRCSGCALKANKAQLVGTTNGSSGTPYTQGFPQFQPPPTHMRSYSSASPSFRRFCAELGSTESCWPSSASRAKAVGSTQLLVLGVQPQPRAPSANLKC